MVILRLKADERDLRVVGADRQRAKCSRQEHRPELAVELASGHRRSRVVLRDGSRRGSDLARDRILLKHDATERPRLVPGASTRRSLEHDVGHAGVERRNTSRRVDGQKFRRQGGRSGSRRVSGA